MHSVVRPLVKYHGGKYYLCPWIIDQFPLHHTYVEPFGGAGSVLLNKPPAKVEVYGDLEPTIYNLMKVVQMDCEAFVNAVFKLQYEKETYLSLRSVYRSEDFAKLNPIHKAVITYAVRRMSRGGVCGTFSWSKRIASDGTPAEVKAWLTMREEIPQISQRLSEVIIRNEDALSLIREFDSSDTLIYLDPPYPKTTRISKNVYLKEMSDEQHKQLGKLLRTVKSKIIISSYPSELYDQLFAGWRTIDRLIPNHASHGRQKEIKREKLWLNF
jgi:DNA adenine methylase